MDLFSQKISQPENMLPQQGIVKYYGLLLSFPEAEHYFEQLLTSIDWQHDSAVIYGKKITTKRKVAWYGERPFQYTYSNVTKEALPWTEELLKLKSIIEKETGEHFNSCLLNLYHDGTEAMAWHSDGEKDLKKHGAIASLSLGAERKFYFRHIESKQKIALMLEHGSLLVMSGTTQTYWQHCLPAMRRVDTPRINLTFRSICPSF
ncbi:alpha-ketoglutarate-dependent dioxygenase AlkB family protein [Psychromonas sp. KJ10-10]|uniref:alpha-ketoglutarate-dependent dioxygenase AlkB family protein n=1 Tax=Psychromonas sp. KJ10-10 TaxID=3391823 RepID=UPI0039B38F51